MIFEIYISLVCRRLTDNPRGKLTNITLIYTIEPPLTCMSICHYIFHRTNTCFFVVRVLSACDYCQLISRPFSLWGSYINGHLADSRTLACSHSLTHTQNKDLVALILYIHSSVVIGNVLCKSLAQYLLFFDWLLL